MGQPGGGCAGSVGSWRGGEAPAQNQRVKGGLRNREPREQEVLTLQSAPQAQANPTALQCFFLTDDFL